VRLEVVDARISRARWLVSGASTQPRKAVEPIPVAVDHLEIALDRCLAQAHQLGVFEVLVAARE
jgi:hypothetical protein